jgi:hypothetical protein
MSRETGANMNKILILVVIFLAISLAPAPVLGSPLEVNLTHPIDSESYNTTFLDCNATVNDTADTCICQLTTPLTLLNYSMTNDTATTYNYNFSGLINGSEYGAMVFCNTTSSDWYVSPSANFTIFQAGEEASGSGLENMDEVLAVGSILLFILIAFFFAWLGQHYEFDLSIKYFFVAVAILIVIASVIMANKINPYDELEPVLDVSTYVLILIFIFYVYYILVKTIEDIVIWIQNIGKPPREQRRRER